jgi:hypothetical protein
MDHLSAKGFVNATAQRVRRLLMVTGIALLCASPALITLSSALLVHSHGHSAVCELEQRMVGTQRTQKPSSPKCHPSKSKMFSSSPPPPL